MLGTALLAAAVAAVVLFCVYFLFGARLLSWIGRVCCRVRVLSRLPPCDSPPHQQRPCTLPNALQASKSLLSPSSRPTKRVVITLDDAPWGTRIRKDDTGSDDDDECDYSLLDSLDIARTHGAHITLLVIGQHLARAPQRISDELRARAAAGEVSLANHGNTGACQ
jgi:hypothetical protein